MAQWQYFLSGTREDAARGESGLYRLPAGGPVALAEVVHPDGRWVPSDKLWKVKYQGADYDFLEIPAEEAEDVVRQWVEIGRLERVPDPASTFTDEQRAALTAADEQARARWRQVEPPPGADSISLF